MNISDTIHVFGAFPGNASKRPRGSTACIIGRDVEFEAAALEAFCFRELSRRDEDLVIIAGLVAFADRSNRRHMSTGWRRSFVLTVPVSEPAFWGRPEVSAKLIEALRFLTGDNWAFNFIGQQGRLPKLKQPELNLGSGKFAVIPFSRGLDSFAQAQLLRYESPTLAQIRLTAWSSALGDRDWVQDGTVRFRRVSIPIGIQAGPHAEQTYRTRSFVFCALAGLAAHLAEAETIIIPEAGQGSWGPSLLPVGSESPHRGSHPGFTRRMEIFFAALWKGGVKIEHPQVWRTKGEVMQMLVKHRIDAGWKDSLSCSQDQRTIRVERRKRIHCGLCSGCLLRRLSAFTAGFSETPEDYFWSDLRAATLDAALCSDARRKTSANDRDIAIHGVLALEELARLADAPASSATFRSNLFDAFGPQSDEDFAQSLKNLRRLLSAHQREWTAYKQALGTESWLNRQIALL